jgi:hypothetical protein
MSDAPKIFLIATTLDGQVKRPHPFEEEFQVHGEWWVTHRRLYGIGFCMSHRDSGYKVPGTDRERAIEAKVKGLEILEAKKDQIAAMIAMVTK